MSKPHLIALDLDGTLLKDDKTISSRTKKVIELAKSQGHIVCISTGRPYRASVQYYNELSLTTPIVNFNGAFVHHPLESSFGYHHTPLDIKTAKTIIETCEAFRVNNIMVEIIDDYYLRYYDKVFIETFTMGQTPVEHGNLQQILQDDPTSVLVHPKGEHIDDLRNLLADAHAEVVDQRSWGAPWNIIEIIRAGMNKAVGLKRIAEYYHIPKDRIIAFGDEDNDLEMIEYAGTGVAMKNGITELKSIANEITLSNEDDGIAIFLEEKLNLKLT
ncbi:Cof-type HAD-IIB family hydrolase [Alkalihalobacterium alkalinitrilicum]|uniref:Cof-type HAD-IIB family hydrolase n=1 Tax=Alkalihalobacterium alkalinitrilicum TaxID=427920 RepID=UPI0009952FF6|nr:Cof-type HAD-IIB family hydrolase [Alkalihalobacterium alkalinitrilicum]